MDNQIVHFSATDPDEWMRNADPLPPTKCGVLGTWTEKRDAVTCDECLLVMQGVLADDPKDDPKWLDDELAPYKSLRGREPEAKA